MPKSLKDPMQQKWIRLRADKWQDQYAHTITRYRNWYRLYHKEDLIAKAHTLQAVKEISLILLNEKLI